jgi:hypothetical protein
VARRRDPAARRPRATAQAAGANTDRGKELKSVEMTTPALQAKKGDELEKAILDGVEKEKGHSFRSELTPERVDALVAYVRTFKK